MPGFGGLFHDLRGCLVCQKVCLRALPGLEGLLCRSFSIFLPLGLGPAKAFPAVAGQESREWCDRYGPPERTGGTGALPCPSCKSVPFSWASGGARAHPSLSHMWQQPRAVGRPLRWRQQLGQGPICLVLTMVLITQLERSDAVGCEMGEYRNGSECCPTCAVGANPVTAAACTYTKSAACGCRPGHFCSSPGPEVCAVCQPYTVCVPGTMVKEWGTATKDHVCEVCPPGTFSSANMSVACTQWPSFNSVVRL
ncbi:uncharacterized protein LOC135425775 isoform X3 [Pseudopipra pipra]|uniref:uncharacterized protein LOC135425775 isoform X3 n=1 Tax=Pseudopipra pipra TaxID=415032 RepID=UPI00313947E9